MILARDQSQRILNLRKNARQARNLPPARCKVPEVDHGADGCKHQHVHPLEAFPDLRNFPKEVGVLLFFCGGAPAHVDIEHVSANSQEDVKGNASEKEDEERGPLGVLQESL